ncbi:unnamed protein product [Mycena citricolor]|uniref:Stealth protein CR1 conserved region 1 domain-containing protein n=1 Tax=Mycena citricolor TaxID=2018698 RepID=A0AAD2HG62_9AGAR|nr:unnamed protein product [Mycena citricolor]
MTSTSPFIHLKPSFILWELLTPPRCRNVLIIVALSLTYFWIILSGRFSESWLVYEPQGVPVVPHDATELQSDQPAPTPTPALIQDQSDGSAVSKPKLKVAVPELPPLRHGSAVYRPFLVPTPAESFADQTVRRIKAHDAFSYECLEHWVATGLWGSPCRHDMVQDSVIDLVYVWVNGSDPLHFESRKSSLNQQKGYRTSEARFREHGELRYSIRSVQQATRTWPNPTIHVVAADVPAPHASTLRLGLVPQWLDVSCASHTFPPVVDEAGLAVQQSQSAIRLHHDTQLFRFTEPSSEVEDVASWLEDVFPSFNSMAVESQLAHLDPDIVSENIVALNDDQFMLLPAPPSAFHTALYGPVFRMQSDLMVDGDARGFVDGNGEWRSLRWSAQLLDRRFGIRKRPYMQHNARALSLPLMHEAALAFGREYANTPRSHFRGSHDVPGEYEINTIFLASHFVVERHREALLWSWVVGKWGSQSGGFLDKGAKARMWRDLGGNENQNGLLFETAERTTREQVDLNLLMAGIQPPGAVHVDSEMDTTYSWVSMDGYTADYKQLPEMVSHSRSACLGTEPEDAWKVFTRLLVSTCGDEVILALTARSKTGLDVFLPAPSNSKESLDDPITLPLELPDSAPALPTNPRVFAVRLIQRYAYVIGDSRTKFLSMNGFLSAQSDLLDIESDHSTALFCLNDDLGTSAPKVLDATDALLRQWFEKRWPERLHCELGP